VADFKQKLPLVNRIKRITSRRIPGFSSDRYNTATDNIKVEKKFLKARI